MILSQIRNSKFISDTTALDESIARFRKESEEDFARLHPDLSETHELYSYPVVVTDISLFEDGSNLRHKQLITLCPNGLCGELTMEKAISAYPHCFVRWQICTI